ncbi:U4/U6-U5 snRNP complex subunit prp38 [Dimargaris cristalligena]|uniref:Pre-mRNA-splicing factor 38 n=1 Tax=Dimargaris cristalligena TaxID=215637 RepID=A0A4Q0A0M7_9FUNG|nr:U4/U6-U5 snRNP complex subunit prp38 [Dimargaris cristalligena]RKP38981.1 Pre-mRNA-splicing factor 38 [Dimargaris cristalligena]|eukprot:RKP38981.1 Pre-mRNA-splicing factor 38 [Dimargaris cristalligena]
MANRTAQEARTVHGTNPQYLIERITRGRIYDSLYWKEECFALTVETLIDKAVDLTCVGGTYGNQKPTEFLCLTLKLLQLQPDYDIVLEFIRDPDFKYLRALGAFYLRLTGKAADIYRELEPLYADYRKLRERSMDGEYFVTHVDEFIDQLIRENRVCDTILPHLVKRHVLEESGDLEPYECLVPLEETIKAPVSSDSE